MSELLTGSVSVPEASTTTTVLGTFSPPYQVALSPSWVTAFSVTNLLSTSFTITYAIPAPAGGGTVTWIVTQPPLALTRSGSVSVPAGATSQVVPGTFRWPYRVAVSPSWVTATAVRDMQATSFTVYFAVAAPAGGGTLSFTVVTAGVGTLADYRAETRRLLRDSSGQLYSDDDLTAFINRALQQRDLDLGLNRSRVRYAMTANVFQYPVAEIIANGTVLSGPPNPAPIDVLSVTVIPLGTADPQQGVRYPLARWPYSRLAPLLSTSYPTYPVAYAMFGTDSVVVAPPPAANYVTEWDFFGYAPPLADENDQDPLGYPWTDVIPFLAAHFAKVQSQRFDEADAFWRLYQQRLAMVRARGRPLAVTKPLADLPRGIR